MLCLALNLEVVRECPELEMEIVQLKDCFTRLGPTRYRLRKHISSVNCRHTDLALGTLKLYVIATSESRA